MMRTMDNKIKVHYSEDNMTITMPGGQQIAQIYRDEDPGIAAMIVLKAMVAQLNLDVAYGYEIEEIE
jgi:hypothetical protein